MTLNEKVLSISLAVVFIGSLTSELAGRYAQRKKPPVTPYPADAGWPIPGPEINEEALSESESLKGDEAVPLRPPAPPPATQSPGEIVKKGG
jgi:hypothetical protein